MRPGWYWNVVFCSIHFTSLSVGNCFISLGQSGPSLPNVSTFGIGYNNGILLCPRPVNSHFGSSPSYHLCFVYMDAIIAQHKKRAIIPIFRNYKFHKSSSAFGQYFWRSSCSSEVYGAFHLLYDSYGMSKKGIVHLFGHSINHYYINNLFPNFGIFILWSCNNVCTYSMVFGLRDIWICSVSIK